MAHDESPDGWEARYASAQVWSGHVNDAVAAIAGTLPVGCALDLGCGEGGDAIWLAEHGWQVTAVDVSKTAVARGAQQLATTGVPADRVKWLARDATTWEPEPGVHFDLVTSSFFYLPDAGQRTEVLRRAARWVGPGGHLLMVTHASAPPWSNLAAHDHADHTFPSAAEEVASLGLDENRWRIDMADVRPREATGPEGQRAVLEDVVVLAVRQPD